jgi:thiol:disulfide interchange protein DsbA
MKSAFRNLLVVALLTFAGITQAAVLGKDYTQLDQPQATPANGKIEVLEFFAYPCPHCHHLVPDLNAWEKTMPKDVSLTYVPVVFRDSWEPMAYTFYALEVLGQQSKLHDALFEAWNVTHTELNDLSQIAAFVAQRGVDKQKFSDAYRSFSVQSKVIRSKQMLQSYNIRGTPTLVVDGRFVITGLESRDMIRVLRELTDQVRKERATKKR